MTKIDLIRSIVNRRCPSRVTLFGSCSDSSALVDDLVLDFAEDERTLQAVGQFRGIRFLPGGFGDKVLSHADGFFDTVFVNTGTSQEVLFHRGHHVESPQGGLEPRRSLRWRLLALEFDLIEDFVANEVGFQAVGDFFLRGLLAGGLIHIGDDRQERLFEIVVNLINLCQCGTDLSLVQTGGRSRPRHFPFVYPSALNRRVPASSRWTYRHETNSKSNFNNYLDSDFNNYLDSEFPSSSD
jgi:hypothetical protein